MTFLQQMSAVALWTLGFNLEKMSKAEIFKKVTWISTSHHGTKSPKIPKEDFFKIQDGRHRR